MHLQRLSQTRLLLPSADAWRGVWQEEQLHLWHAAVDSATVQQLDIGSRLFVPLPGHTQPISVLLQEYAANHSSALHVLRGRVRQHGTLIANARLLRTEAHAILLIENDNSCWIIAVNFVNGQAQLCHDVATKRTDPLKRFFNTQRWLKVA